ncbi:hypothetical protein [Paenibacillus dendritiformis]|uniref:hypothetical protein n=1 Tax=Paenibacillus dendritiformis TaxID=130049 RepID=UPI0011B4FC9D|nr:hypothetical protein [Paenibacillus dendritiformis]
MWRRENGGRQGGGGNSNEHSGRHSGRHGVGHSAGHSGEHRDGHIVDTATHVLADISVGHSLGTATDISWI